MKWAIFFAILLLASLGFNIFLLSKSPTEDTSHKGQTYKVIGVYDGDTFIIEGKRRVRLRQAQSPELDNCGGKEAKAALVKLINGRNIVMENEIPDIYGRPMAIIFADDKNVNLEMVKQGWARYHHDVTPYEGDIKKAGLEAKQNNLGIFGKCELASPVNPKCNIKGNIRPGDNTHIYFLPTCAQYKTSIISEDLGEKWFCSEKEAKAAGFIKAETCK